MVADSNGSEQDYCVDDIGKIRHKCGHPLINDKGLPCIYALILYYIMSCYDYVTLLMYHTISDIMYYDNATHYTIILYYTMTLGDRLRPAPEAGDHLHRRGVQLRPPDFGGEHSGDHASNNDTNSTNHDSRNAHNHTNTSNNKHTTNNHNSNQATTPPSAPSVIVSMVTKPSAQESNDYLHRVAEQTRY